MSLIVKANDNGFGAAIEGLELRKGLSAEAVEEVRNAWLAHQVVFFPNQPLEHLELEAFTRAFGDFGDDPYVAPIDSHEHILEVRREPDEAVSPFGGSWHSDWSFQETPPAATILHAKIVPPTGGNTLYADGIAAYESLSDAMQSELNDLQAVHSARRPYSHEGYQASGGPDRSMTILPDDKAWATQLHPVVRTHPESGRKALWVNPVYTLSIHEMTEPESNRLLEHLFSHALSEQFLYSHGWQANMLTMWDNRSVQHCATGGYDGHRRVMHRTTVAGDQPV